MDYSKVTMLEYQAKKKAILDSIGRIEEMCHGIQCESCPFYVDNCKVSEIAEIENPLEAVKLVMDYEIPVDWSKIAVDTPVLVSDDKVEWFKRYFSGYENKTVYTFTNGRTSWSRDQSGIKDTVGWRYSKLACVENKE